MLSTNRLRHRDLKTISHKIFWNRLLTIQGIIFGHSETTFFWFLKKITWMIKSWLEKLMWNSLKSLCHTFNYSKRSIHSICSNHCTLICIFVQFYNNLLCKFVTFKTLKNILFYIVNEVQHLRRSEFVCKFNFT